MVALCDASDTVSTRENIDTRAGISGMAINYAAAAEIGGSVSRTHVVCRDVFMVGSSMCVFVRRVKVVVLHVSEYTFARTVLANFTLKRIKFEHIEGRNVLAGQTGLC